MELALAALVWAPVATIVFDARVCVGELTGLAELLIFPSIREALAWLWLHWLHWLWPGVVIGALREFRRAPVAPILLVALLCVGE